MAYVGTVLTVLGIVLNSRKRIESWLVWMLGDLIWIIAYWPRHDWAVVITNTVFVGMNIYGWRSWHRKSN